MGYFSNGTEGEIYRETYCVRCLNFKENPDSGTEGCAVMDAHFNFAYGAKGEAKKILDMLIPREGVHNGECRMFAPANMIPDRVYHYVAPQPEAYHLLYEARYELQNFVDSTSDEAAEQLGAIQECYAPDHVCGPECSGKGVSLWLANMNSELLAKKLQDFLGTLIVVEKPKDASS